MFRVQSWSHEFGAHFDVPGGQWELYAAAAIHLSDLPVLAGARAIDDSLPADDPGHVIAEYPVYEVRWCAGGDVLRGYARDYRELADRHGLPLAEFLQDDETTPVLGGDGEVIGWMSSP